MVNMDNQLHWPFPMLYILHINVMYVIILTTTPVFAIL